MIVIGKSSQLYSLIKDKIPEHKALSYGDVDKFDIKNQQILVLWFPEDPTECDHFLITINILSKDNNLLFISTSDLNGISAQVREKFWDLRLKRQAEKIVLANGGAVLRCGVFVPQFNKKIRGFQTSPEDILGFVSDPNIKGIFYTGIPNNSYNRFVLVRIFDHLIMKLSALPLLFRLIATAMSFFRLSLRDRCSNIMFCKHLSVGKGLGALSNLENTVENVAPPLSFQYEDSESYLNFSLKENGFGKKWHGVSPYKTDSEDRTNEFDLYIPLIPKGRLLFPITNLIGHTHRMLVEKICSSKKFVVLHGVGEDGHQDALAVGSCTLNAGLLQNLKIIARSLGKDVNVKFGNHELSSLWPVSIEKSWGKTKIRKFGHSKSVVASNIHDINYLVMPRPVLPVNYETKIIFSSTFSKIKFFLFNFRYDVLVWILYSKLGFRLFSYYKCQLDIQYRVVRECIIKNTGECIELSTGRIFSNEEIKRFAENITGIKLSPNTQVIRNGVNGLHLHCGDIDINFSPVTKKVPGQWYLGSTGNLFGYRFSSHSSYKLTQDQAYSISSHE